MQSAYRFLSTLIVLSIIASASIVNAGQYSGAWPEYIADHSRDQMVSGIITMADQVDLRALQGHLYAIHADRQLWHETVVRALQEKATTTQADILAELADLKAQGKVESYRNLWIGNIVIVKGSPEAFDLLKDRADVEQISPDFPIEAIVPAKIWSDSGHIIAHVEYPLRAIGVDSCWALGITGAGRLVSSLDSGVDGTHPALASRWKGMADPRYDGHPEWAWYDPIYHSRFPADTAGIPHGTHVMGIVCGLGADTGDTIGVAIGAEWITAAITYRHLTWDQLVSYALTSLQWAADPDGDPATVWDVPDVNNGSWGIPPRYLDDPCDEMFWVAIDGCEAAGVAVIFAAGNEGPNAETIRNPANRAISNTTCFSVGAVDADDPEFPIADFSSRGPSYCTPDSSDAIKPEISSPGVNIRSAMPGGIYQSADGTSGAAPFVSGVVALMRQANPDLPTEQVYQILLETAVDRGTPGDDNVYGMGVVNAYQAVLRAIAYRDCRGLLSGVITDYISGDSIVGALITVVNHNPPISAFSGPDGHYNLRIPADTLNRITIEKPPIYQPGNDSLLIQCRDTLYQNYALVPACQYVMGDINGNGRASGIDIVYGVNYFKGGFTPPLDCHWLCSNEPDPFYAAGDVNGNCEFDGLDIAFYVRYLKGEVAGLRYCPDCPPASQSGQR